MPIILTTDTDALQQIRDLVSVAQDSVTIANATIIQDVFLGDADLRIQAAIPEWASLTGDNQKRLQIITLKLCAVNLLIAFSRNKRQQVDDLSVDSLQLTPAEAIARYESDITKGIKFLNPEARDVDDVVGDTSLPTTRDFDFITAAVVV